MTSFKSSNSKSVYLDNKGDYVYSEINDYGSLYAAQYSTYYPDDDEIAEYKKYLFESHTLACKHFNCEIISTDPLITRTPKYDGTLLDYFAIEENKSDICFSNVMDKLVDIVVYMKKNKLIHDDLAFRNICYTHTHKSELKLYVIDFDQLHENEFEEDYVSINDEIMYLLEDIKDICGIDQYNKFAKMLCEKMSK